MSYWQFPHSAAGDPRLRVWVCGPSLDDLLGGRCLEEALALELLDPRLGPVLAHVVLVVLVAQQAHELAVALGLGGGVVVPVRAGGAHHLAPRRREEVVELPGRVAVVLAVRRLVAHAEHGHVLPRQVQVRERLVEPRVPLGPGPLLLLVGAPTWHT